MKKIMTKVICGALLFVMIFGMGITGGCARESFNAELIDNPLPYMNEQYIEDNRTLKNDDGAIYNYPDRVIDLIKNREEFEQAFIGFPKKVDFNREMLVVIFFTGEPTYTSQTKHISYKLKETEVKDKIMTVTVSYKNLDESANCAPGGNLGPHQVALVIKMEKN